MVGFLLVVIGFIVIYLIAVEDRNEGHQAVVWTLECAYGLRLILQSFLRDVPFFTHGAGGDSVMYEFYGQLVATEWEHTGYHYVSQSEFANTITQNPLPVNVFATVIYLNGGPTRLGCTAVVAICACLTCYNLYRLALELGAKQEFAFRVMALTLFGPAFLMYTADTYKDGFVAVLTTGAVASAFRLAHRVSWLHACLGILCLIGLWQVRFYLVFVSVLPFIVGVAGLKSRSLMRPLVVCGVLCAVGFAIVGYSNLLGAATQRAEHTFVVGTSAAVLQDNATGGSGVTFDDGGQAFGAFGPKVAYMLFSPFPWQLGSVGFQIGKLDAFIWYFLAYRAFISARRLFRENMVLLLMFLMFILPMIIAYSATMSNIGLIVRERLPLVLVCALLATLSNPAPVEQPVGEDGEPDPEPSLHPHASVSVQ